MMKYDFFIKACIIRNITYIFFNQNDRYEESSGIA